MQQTQTYKLNKPETTDPFTPAPLNENADKLDAALADVSQRVIKLEGCRIIAGWYQGSGIIDLGERPVAVLASYHATNQGITSLVVGDRICTCNSGYTIKLTDNGFSVANLLGQSNANGYFFIAFLGGWPTKEFPKA